MKKQLFFVLFISLCGVSGYVYAQAQEQRATAEDAESSAAYIALLTFDTELRSAKPIIATLQQVARDPRIKGLILHMNCYGGSMGTSQGIFTEIKKLRERKPVVVVVENACVSGAYWIAAGADYIFALPSSDVGGIGVICTLSQYKNMQFREDDISGNAEIVTITIGDYKGIGNPYKKLEKHHLAYMKRKAEMKYDQFVADIAAARRLALAHEKLWANGQTFTGAEALELGLVDALGGFSDAQEKMKELLTARGIGIDDNVTILDVSHQKQEKEA